MPWRNPQELRGGFSSPAPGHLVDELFHNLIRQAVRHSAGCFAHHLLEAHAVLRIREWVWLRLRILRNVAWVGSVVIDSHESQSVHPNAAGLWWSLLRVAVLRLGLRVVGLALRWIG